MPTKPKEKRKRVNLGPDLCRGTDGKPYTSPKVRENPQQHVSMRYIAKLVRQDRSVVERRIAESGAAPSGYRAGHCVYDLQTLWTVFGPKPSPSPEQLDAMSSIDRLAWYKSERLRIQLDDESDTLHTAEDCTTEIKRRNRLTDECLDAIPDELAKHCALTPPMVAAVRAHLDKARLGLDPKAE